MNQARSGEYRLRLSGKGAGLSMGAAGLPGMTLEHFSEATAHLRAASADTLSGTVTEIEQTAQAHGLALVRASLDIDGVVALDEQHLDAAQVVELAALVGTRLLYLTCTKVDAQAMATVIADHDVPVGDDPDRATFVLALRSVDGYTSTVELEFAHVGVLHTWTVLAAWADALDSVRTYIRHPNYPEGGSWPLSTQSGPDEAAISRMADQLAADPAFRRARRPDEHHAAARALPALADIAEGEQRWAIRRVVIEALNRLHQQAGSVLDQLQPCLDELAAELAGTVAFRAARLVDARRRVAEDWIATYHTDGLRMPTWWIKELVAAAKHHPGNQLNFG